MATRTGFVGRTDVQMTMGGAGYGWRLREGAVKHVDRRHRERRARPDGGLRGQSLGASCWLSLRPDVSVSLMTSAGRSQYQVLGVRGLQWAGRFMPARDVWAGLFWSRPGWLKSIHANASWARTGVYTGGFAGVEPGRSTSVEGSLTFRPRSDIEIETGADYIRQVADRAGAAGFSGLTCEASLHYQVTRSSSAAGCAGRARTSAHVDLVADYFGAGNVAGGYKRGSRLDWGASRASAPSRRVSYCCGCSASERARARPPRRGVAPAPRVCRHANTGGRGRPEARGLPREGPARAFAVDACHDRAGRSRWPARRHATS